MSASGSNPQKRSYPTSETTATDPEEVLQRDLKKHVEDELAGHAWEFDAVDVLSPKILKKEHEDQDLLELGHFDILIDHPQVIYAMTHAFGDVPHPNPFSKADYDNISHFLNECVRRCLDAYDSILETPMTPDLQAWELQPFGAAFWPALLFTKYDRPTGDKVKNAAPLKPDIVGVAVTDAPPNNFVACWSKLPKQSKREPRKIAIAVEVKADWKDMLLQSTTYGRAQCNDTPLRTFTVIVAINHAAEALRVLIFHRGGLSASKELRLTTKDWKAHSIPQFIKVLLSILLWQTPGDAGYPEFTDTEKFVFPSGEDNIVQGIQKEVLHNRQSSCGRNTFVALMQPFSSLDNEAISPTLLASGTAKPSTGKTSTHVSTDTRPPMEQSQLPKRKLEAESLPAVAPKKLKLEQISTKDDDSDEYDIISPSPYNFNGSFNIRFRDHRAIRKKRVYEKVSESFIMKGSWPPRAKKDVEHNMYQASKGEFGTATLLSSHEPLNSRGCKSTNSYNSYFLPGPNLKFSDFHLKDIGSICPEEPDYRTLAVTLLRDQGCSLEYCDTAWDLCICLAHAMLGWLSTYQCGYMQRDVSIGNVLKLTQPIKTAPFNINKLHEFHDAIMRDNKSVGELSDAVRDKVMALDLEGGIHDSKTAQEAKDEVRKVMSAAEALQGGIAELGLSVDATECWAIISDGDLASYIPTYLTRTVTAESISGTYEFMSPGVHLAIEKKTPYLHSPLDEMFSFFYVALWATFWNIEKGHTPDEDLWRDGLRSKERDARVVGLLVERFTEASQTYAPIAAGMLPVLGDWWGRLSQLRDSFIAALQASRGILRLVYFEQLAYRGVADFIQIVNEHWLNF